MKGGGGLATIARRIQHRKERLLSRGIVYYNTGTKLLVRLAVSLASLRRTCSAPVTLLHEGALPTWFRGLASEWTVDCLEIQRAPAPLVQKAALWRSSPYEISLYLDADTFVRHDPSPLFAAVADAGFVVGRFADWITSGRRVGGRLRRWSGVVDSHTLTAAEAYGPAVNTGVFGFARGHPILPQWEALTLAGYRAAGPDRRVLDEIACQLLLPRHDVQVLAESWNRSVVYGRSDDPAIVHFHGSKHLIPDNPFCEEWARAYWALRHRREGLDDPQGDRRLRDHLYAGSRKYGSAPAVRTDLTIVTAADRRYVPLLTANFERWMEMPGLREQQYIVFAVNTDPNDQAFAPLRDRRNVRLIHWLFDAPSPREAAFTAFVFGVARHVTTPYWMKLDADAHPVATRFQWPDYRRATITAHRWGYTRVKGDPHARRHWLNTLDAWWGGEPAFPSDIPVNQRFYAKRINSFCSIESTAFTRRLAQRCGQRLPVPSQDTTSWYAAMREGEPIQRINMKRWLHQ